MKYEENDWISCTFISIFKYNKHNAELQRTAPDAQDKGINDHISAQNVLNCLLIATVLVGENALKC